MSNPTTLQELADSLAASAQEAHGRIQRRLAAGQTIAAEYEGGYRQALLDARATVMGMIDAGRVAIKGVHEYPAPTTVYEYAWDPAAPGIVHLVDPSLPVTHTLCGVSTWPTAKGFVAGDETTSALACNCPGCKDEFHVIKAGGERNNMRPDVAERINAELQGIVDRKRAGIDNTADESCVVLSHFDTTNGDVDDPIAGLFPLELDQWYTEHEAGLR